MEQVALDEDEFHPVVNGVLNDRMKSAGVVPEALGKPVLSITQVKIARMDEVHWDLKGATG